MLTIDEQIVLERRREMMNGAGAMLAAQMLNESIDELFNRFGKQITVEGVADYMTTLAECAQRFAAQIKKDKETRR